MSLDRLADELKGKLAIKAITASVEITVRDRVCTVSTALGAVVVTMPSISESAGMFFSFTIIVAGGLNLTFIDNNNDSHSSTEMQALTIEDAGDAVVLYSDGFNWHVIANYEAD